MSARCFLDTNIFVYSFDQSDPRKAGVSRKLIQDHLRDRTGVISFQVVQEFLNVATKRFPAFLASPDAELYIAAVFQPLLGVQSSVGLYNEALHIHQRYRLSWYDSIIVAAANEARCQVIYTEDMQAGATIKGVLVKNPF